MRKALYFVIAGIVTAKNMANDFRLRRLDKANIAFDIFTGVCWLPIFVIGNFAVMLNEMGFIDLNTMGLLYKTKAKKELEESNFGETENE